MNIFYLDSDPVSCASMHCDKHVVKMMLEYAQLMSTAHHFLDSGTSLYRQLSDHLYKPTHANHPCSLWVRGSIQHYDWLYRMWCALSDEYTKRYDKVHASWNRLHDVLAGAPKRIPKRGWVEPPMCMPLEFIEAKNTIAAYREYYMKKKSKFARWKYSPAPKWFLA